jgi:ethanolamine ammonia-lyase large subunit
MGMAPCYTLHSRTILEGQQIATQLLTAAGANYFMDVCLNTDRMLAYFDTSAHDVQTLREIYGRNSAPEFQDWALSREIFERDAQGQIARGPEWGNPRQFCETDDEFQQLLVRTPALYGLATAGPRPTNSVTRRTKLNQAVARTAIHAELDIDALERITPFRALHTESINKEMHLNSQERGTHLSAESLGILSPEHRQVQIVVSDGLSAEAVNHNLPDLLPVLLDGLRARKVEMGKPILVRYGRVKLAEQIADALQCELVVYLLGERPGGDALASRSLSAYLVYRLSGSSLAEAVRFSGNPAIRFEYTVISNIYSGGLPPVEAGAVIVETIFRILSCRAAGNRMVSTLA